MPRRAPAWCSAVPGDRSEGWVSQRRSEVMARNGIVATSQPLAAQAGLDILKQGGNAIDRRRRHALPCSASSSR